MSHRSQMLTVINIAELCGVARSTVSYWISEKKLQAHLFGKKHMVSVEDLIHFLDSQGRPIPQLLLENLGLNFSNPFKPLKRCWEYWADESHGKKCRTCMVFRYNLGECFTVRDNDNGQCPADCHECRYFFDYYVPRVAFIHEIEKPAAIFKDLYLWSGNRPWANLCGVDPVELIGAGIEEFIHPDTLKTIIGYNKKMHQGDRSGPSRYLAFFTHHGKANAEVYLSLTPLRRPSGACLAIVDRRIS